MRSLLRGLDDPQLATRGALIGGTNGKGSTQAMVASVLGAAGLVVGQAPSPHLASYRERIVVGGRTIEDDDLDRVLEDALDASLAGERRHGPATEFELLIAAAFLWFARQAVDVAVIEVGLGGRLDATNAWDGGVAAITNVGLDHQQYLGTTVERIAREKAAIVKRGDLAVTGATGPALAVIARRAARLAVPLRRVTALPVQDMAPTGLLVDVPDVGPVRLGLTGRHQAANAAVAVGVVRALGDAGIARVDAAGIRSGLERARWPGRLETVTSRDVSVILDGAHNPDGATALAAALEELWPSLPEGRVTLLLGMLADKEVALMLQAMASGTRLRSARVVATDVPGTDRSLSATSLAEAWAALPGTAADVEAVADADAALARALGHARSQRGPMVVAGSLYLVGRVRARLMGEPPDRPGPLGAAG